MTEIPGILGRMPGGFPTLSGGTRSKLKLNRPFQMPLEGLVNPSKCIFCNMSPEKLVDQTFHIPEFDEPNGWRRLKNIFTPHPDHRLIIPDTCWTVDELQHWGGIKALHRAITMGAAESGGGQEKVLLVNVGMQAGQNIGHPHMHVFTTLPEEVLGRNELECLMNDASVDIKSGDSSFVMVAAGSRGGECQIIPQKMRFSLNSTPNTHILASAIAHLISRCNRAFLSDPAPVLFDTVAHQIVVPVTMRADDLTTWNDRLENGGLRLDLQQLPPAWSLAIRIDGDGCLRYASYAPDLHCVGALERCVSMFERTPYILPWPHEVTAQHLREAA